MNIKQIIKEEISRVLRENDPTVAPPKPKVKPDTPTKPSKPVRRRPLTPPKTAPQTSPKAKIKELFIDDDGNRINDPRNPEDVSQYGFNTSGPQNTDLVSSLEKVAQLISNNQGKQALALVNSIIAEFNQVTGDSQLNEDEKQIANQIAKRFASKKK